MNLMLYTLTQLVVCILCVASTVYSYKNRAKAFKVDVKNARRNIIISAIVFILMILAIIAHSLILQICVALALICEYLHGRLLYKKIK